MQLEVIEPTKKQVKFDDDPLVSMIVPAHAYNLDPAILKRCLMSLADQDYENMEVIVVINGGNDDKIIDTCKFFCEKDKRFAYYCDQYANACSARNFGFNISKGEIVSFFNSDYRAKPGMVRMWVDALVNHPDCGFAYGGYEFATSPSYAYVSKPFDSWELTQANYIDCGFPIWRKHVERWDEKVKSLQDWDFWLSVVKKGVKGHYLGRELSYVAELPRRGGLSHDSHNNWVERVNFVKTKHGIKSSPIVVTSIGARFHGKEIAKMIGADYRDDTIMKPNNYKAVYMIGFFMKPDQKSNDHGPILASFAPEVKKIIHFVGADVYWLRKFPYDSMRYLAGVMKMGADHILCENEQAQKELKAFGIDANILPIPPYNDYSIRPFPTTFKVAVYLTDKSDFDKYAQKHTLSIIKAMPDIQFTGYGDGARDFVAPNFRHAGNMSISEWKDFVYEHSSVLRIVRHDTLPMAPCEFLMAGRSVVTNIPMAYSNYIDTKGDNPMTDWDLFSPGLNDLRWPETKKKIVRELRAVRKSKLNTDAADHYKWLLDRNKYMSRIYSMAGVFRG